MPNVPGLSDPPRSSKRPPLVTPRDVRAEIERLFDAGDTNLVIRVYGETDDASSTAAQATFREMLQSLNMYSDGGLRLGDALVAPPDKKAIARALAVLSREAHQRTVLDKALTTFGRRLIDPLGDLLDGPQDGVQPKLVMLRDIFLTQIKELRLSRESQQILVDDLGKFLRDDYLAMLAEHEERVQHPRARKLAHQILRLVASSFHSVLRRWPGHAEQLAIPIARRLPKKVRVREVPQLMRGQITAGIEEFLWVETSTEILGALKPLLAEHGGLTDVAPKELDRAAYRELANACFEVVAENC